jgi:hypothetical protein
MALLNVACPSSFRKLLSKNLLERDDSSEEENLRYGLDT